MGNRMMLIAITSFATATAAATEEPPWLREARAREAAPMAANTIESKDGRFSARVPARSRGKIIEQQGSYSIELDVGDRDAAVYCEVYPEGVDLAETLRLTSETSFKLLSEQQGRIGARELERSDAGWNGAAAYLQAEWIYLVEAGTDKRLGALKQIVFDLDGGSLYCSHNNLGYRQTFERAAHELARTLSWSEAPPAPRYRDVLVMKLGDRTAGVARLVVARDADGDDRVVTSLSMLLPVAAGEVRSHDEVQVEFVAADGELINAVQVASQNGVLDAELRLDPHQDGGWLVSGTYKGKPIEAKIDGTTQPSSTLRQYALVGGLLQSPDAAGRSVEFLLWSDNAPTTLTATTVTAVSPREGGLWAVKFSMSGLEYEAIADARNGAMVSATMPLGALTMHLERVAVAGQL